MKGIFRLLLAISSTSLLPIIYLIKSKVCIFPSGICSYIASQSDWVRNFYLLVYLVLPILLFFVIIWMVPCLGKDKIKKDEVLEVQDASSSFLPSYLGYFFVALSINDGNIFTMCFIWILLIVFVSISQVNYYNPVFLLFGYKFYHVKTKNGLVLFLISKDEFKKVSDVIIPKVYRINNFTFIHKDLL